MFILCFKKSLLEGDKKEQPAATLYIIILFSVYVVKLHKTKLGPYNHV